MIKKGGILAGHDYQNHGEPSLSCRGCGAIPYARNYTSAGIAFGKKSGLASNQVGVVRAVQEWLTSEHPEVTLHHTEENFTRESLARDNIDFDLVLTSTVNPSWYIVKSSK